MSSEEYKAWINPLEFTTNKSPSGNKDLFILAPNAFIKEHVRENYDEIIRKHLLKDELSGLPLVYELISVRKPLINKEKNKNFLDNYRSNASFSNRSNARLCRYFSSRG